MKNLKRRSFLSVDTLFWLKNRIFRRGAMKQYREALLLNDLSENELNHLNWEKRKRIVNHAYHHSSFYKRFYDTHGFTPSMLSHEADWDKIPILEKDDVRKYREEIKDIRVPAKYIGVATTGGSTGIPLKIYTDKRVCFEILGWRSFGWWNISPAAHVGIIHRNVPSNFIKRFINRLMWYPTRRCYLDASSIVEKEIGRFVDSLRSQRTRWIVGYVGGIEKVADYILANDIQIKSVCLVWATSAPLLDFVRKKIERAFQCPVMDQYGCNESLNIAIQCPKCKDLHVNSDYVHVDIVDSAGNLLRKDVLGDILITNLEGEVFPLIKYRLGDKSELLSGRCSCGLPYPLIKKVSGRISDAVYTPSGIRLDGVYLTSIMDDYTDYALNFRIHQNIDYSVVVYIVPVKEKQTELPVILSKIQRTLSSKVKNEIPIQMLCVDELKDDRGKNKYIISEIALEMAKK